MVDVTVIDYGVGNLLSVSRALQHCGARVTISADPATIRHASRVVLPGVGSFADSMSALRADGLDEVVREVATNGTALLGICLGMQMLLDQSDEHGPTAGLGLIPGRVVRIPATGARGMVHKIPHIGWSALLPPPGRQSWEATVMDTTRPGEAAYFVHSFMAEPEALGHRLADCDYNGVVISAAIERDNVLGCQFHPEKSGLVGLNILTRFLAR